MDAQTINQTYDLLALALRDSPKLRKAGAYYIGPCPFCRGTDRFTLKPTRYGWRWYCRHCGEGKYHTAIDYIMRREKLSFKDAFSQMGGDEAQAISDRTSVTLPAPADMLTLPDATWQAETWRMVDKANDRLLNNPAGAPGRDELVRRGFSLDIIDTWLLGFMQAFDPRAGKRRPALIIPWWDIDKQNYIITAVKYRFIDDLARQDKSRRFGQKKGSVPVLFGMCYALESDSTLLLVEGEFNALSIWQVHPEGTTCLSFGSESGGRPEILRSLANHYRRVILWCDDSAQAEKHRAMISDAEAWQSPVIDGVKWDANQMLRVGCLASFLEQKLNTPSKKV